MTKKQREEKIQLIFQILKSKNLKLAACESFTGGSFADAITNVKGSSNVFLGSLVLYANEEKIKIAKIKKRTIKKYGVVSQECAEEMARNTNKVMGSHIAVSFTGNADINVMENKPPFNGYISIYYLGLMKSYKLDLSNGKNMNREKFKQAAIDLAVENILGILV